MAQKEIGDASGAGSLQARGKARYVAGDRERLLEFGAGLAGALAEARLELFGRDVPEARIRLSWLKS